MILRDYQVRAVDETRRVYASGAHRVCIVAPTGAGKTVIACAIARGAVAKGRRVLWLAHRAELVDQAHRKLYALGLRPGVIQPGTEQQLDRAIQVASIETLVARDMRPHADVVIWDECHHVAANTWAQVAEHYRNCALLGLTATPQRADGRGLRDAFDQLVVVAQPAELIASGHLVPTQVYAPADKQSALAMDPLDAYRQIAPDTQALVFCPNVAHAQELAQRFDAAGFPAQCVDGNLSSSVRSKHLTSFAQCDLRVLTNVYVLTEGYDCPGIQTVILASGSSSQGTYLQKVGRGLRPDPSKDHVKIIDLVGAVHEHGLPDEPRSYSLDGKPIRPSEQALALRTCRECGGVQRPAQFCARCGVEFPPPPPPKIRQTEVALVEARATRPDSQRRAAYDRLVATGKAKGYKPGWAKWKYKSLYGHWPGGWQ
jgi:superfamily II DNA or RNA helicase